MVGTATASNNFFRQIGGTAGSAIIGSLFTHRVADLMGQRVPGALQELGPQGAEFAKDFQGGGSARLTPEIVDTLPGPLHDAITTSYNDALVPVLGAMAPVAVLAALILVLVRQDTLKETIE